MEVVNDHVTLDVIQDDDEALVRNHSQKRFPVSRAGEAKQEPEEPQQSKIDMPKDKGKDIAQSEDDPMAVAIHSANTTPFKDYARFLRRAKPKLFIRRVHSGLRDESSAKHYEPVLLSIGPYHYGKTPLRDMENYKYYYVELQDRYDEAVTYDTIMVNEDGVTEETQLQAIDFYADTFQTDEGVIKCIVRDGCFMIELFRRNKKRANIGTSSESRVREANNDMIFDIKWMKPRLARDMLLFENQIPLFVLRKLFELTEQTPEEEEKLQIASTSEKTEQTPEEEEKLQIASTSEKTEQTPEKEEKLQIASPSEKTEQAPEKKEKFSILALEYFEFNGSPINGSPRDDDLNDIPHLLGLVYHALVPETLGQCQSNFNGSPINGSLRDYALDVIRHLIGLVYHALVPERLGQRQSGEFIRTAVALDKLGVKFAKARDDKKFYEIEFYRGVFSIPRLIINENTESFFRNLVAYEEYSEHYSLHRVADYLRVMDCLINSYKDVELLRHCGIIDSRIGDDVKVSTMFNNLCSGVYFDQKKFFYAKTFDRVNKFCENPWNMWWAMLGNDYFGSPWSKISFGAAFTLLVLTAVQTVYTVLGYYKQ